MEPRIEPLPDDRVPSRSSAILRKVDAAVGMIPNLHRVLAHAPAALDAYVGTVGALSGGTLEPALREQLAVAIAGSNRCDYCASAHTMLGKAAGVEREELRRNLGGDSNDPRVAAALRFARALLEHTGAISDAELRATRDAGLSEAELVEIVAHVGVNVFSNTINRLARTPIDFPSIGVVLQPVE